MLDGTAGTLADIKKATADFYAAADGSAPTKVVRDVVATHLTPTFRLSLFDSPKPKTLPYRTWRRS